MAIIPSNLSSTVAALTRVTQEQGKTLGKIAEGVKSGAITPKEARKLMEGQQKVSQAVVSALADDGEISLGEELGLLKQNLDSLKNVKAAYEHAPQDAFATDGASALRQIQQLGAIAQGVSQGSIDLGEATRLLEGQAALAHARSQSNTPEDLALLDMSEELLGEAIELAKLTDDPTTL